MNELNNLHALMERHYNKETPLYAEDSFTKRIQVNSSVLTAIEFIRNKYPDQFNNSCETAIISYLLDKEFNRFFEADEAPDDFPILYYRINQMLERVGYKNSTYYISVARSIFGIKIPYSRNGLSEIYTDTLNSKFSELFGLRDSWLGSGKGPMGEYIELNKKLNDLIIEDDICFSAVCVDVDLCIVKSIDMVGKEYHYIGQYYTLESRGTDIKGWRNIGCVTTGGGSPLLNDAVVTAISNQQVVKVVSVEHSELRSLISGEQHVLVNQLYMKARKAKKEDIKALFDDHTKNQIEKDVVNAIAIAK